MNILVIFLLTVRYFFNNLNSHTLTETDILITFIPYSLNDSSTTIESFTFQRTVEIALLKLGLHPHGQFNHMCD